MGTLDTIYGNPWQTDGLNNFQIGASTSSKAAIKDRSIHTGTINSIDLYRKSDGTSGTGTNTYWNGTGGSWTVRCESDNGSGLPSGTLINTGATATASTPSPTSAIQTFTFSTPIPDTIGTLRHFVISNADGAPATNFCSINSQDLSNGDNSWQPNPLQPNYLDADRAFLANVSNGGFVLNRNRYPIFALLYADSFTAGQSYYDALSGSGQREIGSGGRMVRMKFTPSVNVTVSAAHARVYKSSSSTAAVLTFNIRDLTGSTLLATVNTAAASVNLGSTLSGYGARYIDWTLSSNITFIAGRNYSFEMASTEATNPYISFPSRRGGGASFAPTLVGPDRFLEGNWEYTTDGSTWLTHSPGTTEQQMQLFFDTVTAPTTSNTIGFLVQHR